MHGEKNSGVLCHAKGYSMYMTLCITFCACLSFYLSICIFVPVYLDRFFFDFCVIMV